MSEAVVVDRVSKSFRLRHTQTFRDLARRKSSRNSDAEMVRALRSVSLEVHEGEGVALMGMNGSGKSTLLKLMSGVMRPDEGSVLARGRVAGLIEIGAGMSPELTGRENVYLNAAILGMSRAQTEARFDAIVDFAGIERFLETELKFYSSGMFMRIAFAVAVHTEPDVFLVDEVLAVGDSQFKRKCRRALLARRRDGLTLIMVAHETALLRKLCTRGIVLDDGALVYDGALAGAETLVNDDDD